MEIDSKQNCKSADNGVQELTKLAPKQSIQDAFKRFQKEKFYQLKLNKYLKQTDIDRSSPEHTQQLRAKFLETAKKYIGVPYAKYYHKPGDPLYDAPLFLDCCAFIRQVVFDLRADFGFTLGKWNQAYQFDMLPDEGLTEADLQPGDIIFYSAIYYNKRIKPFPHNMVHVEIYMGQGKSLGSRWQKGTIQVFDSYKFESKLYYDIQYHYRSLNSWLKGELKNHCNEHKWLDDRANEWLSEKFSVFADPSLDDMKIVEKQVQGPRGVFIGKGTHLKVVRDKFKAEVAKSGEFFLMPQKQQFSKDYFFKWVQTASEIDFHSFREGKQIVNHIPGLSVLTIKADLAKTLANFSTKTGIDLDLFVPKTYRLDVMSDEIEFVNSKSEGLWIYKPRHLNQGRGIQLIGDVVQFKKEFLASKKFYLGEFSLNNMLYYKPELNPLKQQDPCPTTKKGVDINNSQSEDKQVPEARYSHIQQDGLIQKYIKPLLLDGFKFDIRCYMLVFSQPRIVLYNPGYLRLSLQKYSEEDIENPENLFTHLTNNCFQRKHKDWKTLSDTTIAKWSRLEQQLGKQKTEKLTKDIQDIMRVLYAAALPKLEKKKGQFELLGCDIVVGEDSRPYLLEVNTNPALFLDTTVQKEVIPPVVHATIDMALDVWETPEDDRTVLKTALDKYAGVFEAIIEPQIADLQGLDAYVKKFVKKEINQ